MLKSLKIPNILNLIIVFIIASSSTVSDTDQYTSLKQFPPRNPVNAEFVIQADPAGCWLFSRYETSQKQKNESGSAGTFFEHLSRILPQRDDTPTYQPNLLPTPRVDLQVVSILQKNHTWHQSSDDVPPLVILS